MNTVDNSINMFGFILTSLFESVLGTYKIKSVLVLLPLEAALYFEVNLSSFNLRPILPWSV